MALRPERALIRAPGLILRLPAGRLWKAVSAIGLPTTRAQSIDVGCVSRVQMIVVFLSGSAVERKVSQKFSGYEVRL